MDKKLALVTGASSGIGEATAVLLAENGYCVIGTSTSDNGAAKIQQMLDTHGDCHLGIRLDVTQTDDIDATFKTIEAKYGASPDVVVNNAGIALDNLLMRMSEDDWSRVIDTNLTSIYRISHRAIRPMMKKRFGRIINIGSIVAQKGNPGQASYCAAKAGVEGFSRSLAIELAGRGITVNTIAPGFVATRMTEQLTDEQTQHIMAQVPVNRMAEPQEIAHGVLYLASENASYVTGTVLHINGGMYM